MHDVLDGIGLVPGFGEPADLANAGIYLLEKKPGMAVLSGGAAIPFIGWAATAGKYGWKIPQLGRKLEYLLGKATGNIHNVSRSIDMLKQLERIGLHDNRATREYLTTHLAKVLNDSSSIARIQENGRIVRESLLMGPQGGVKLESIWEGNKVITFNLFGGI